ncbi:hypothetical protein VPH184E373B_0119 [Vibrio phage 184E37-3b]|nr:hypothetical protein MYOV056v2_p0104 [Vibrio phage 184E37.3a]QZI89950.1 hypothetical protein MYOV057v1_p0035 [Vibrio phage 184E37.1]
MKVVKPIQASPEFIRDNQYNPKYEVLYEEDNPEIWEYRVEYYGKERIMCFPSGRECFFSEVL